MYVEYVSGRVENEIISYISLFNLKNPCLAVAALDKHQLIYI